MSYSNNKYPKCPALMEDGKIFTDYRAHKIGDLDLAKKNKVVGSNQYRMFLQKNGESLIINNKEELSKYVCSPRKDRKYDPLNVTNFQGFDKKSMAANAGAF